MCGRYTGTKDLSELAKRIAFLSVGYFFAPRYNIAPTQSAPVISFQKNQPQLKMMRWGLIPKWAKDESVGGKLINARKETLLEKPTFKTALKERRCLIPADSFYEWKDVNGKKQPYRIMFKSREIFCFAGLWERWVKPRLTDDFFVNDFDEEPNPDQIIDSFTIITTRANSTIQPIHDRMPLIVEPEHYDWWLDTRPGHEMYQSVLDNPREEPMKIYPVSPMVNNARVDDPSCIQPFRLG
jgi:putative SOS response-associated peptidase YedK